MRNCGRIQINSVLRDFWKQMVQWTSGKLKSSRWFFHLVTELFFNSHRIFNALFLLINQASVSVLENQLRRVRFSCFWWDSFKCLNFNAFLDKRNQLQPHKSDSPTPRIHSMWSSRSETIECALQLDFSNYTFSSLKFLFVSLVTHTVPDSPKH